MRHASIPSPDPDLVVWRYMHFDKLVDLISTRTLHFARLDQFKDAHEGYIPTCDASAPRPHEIAAQRHAWAWRFLTFASCWHIFPEENALMWPNYGQDGVAIKSTIGKLETVALFHSNVYVARVIYDPWPNPLPPGFHWQLPVRKRLEFASEAELRIVLEDIDLPIMGDFTQLGEAPPLHWPTFHKVTFDGLPFIDEIRTHPEASDDFRNRVIGLTLQNGFSIPILPSSLLPKPIWIAA
jgi:hypothetical protein